MPRLLRLLPLMLLMLLMLPCAASLGLPATAGASVPRVVFIEDFSATW